MIRNVVFLSLMLLGFISSCSESKPNSNSETIAMQLDGSEKKYLDEILYHYDDIGLSSIKVVDSLLIVGHRTHWNILKADGTHIANCFNVGQGPNEVRYCPISNRVSFFQEEDSLFAYFYDMGRRVISRINISRALNGEPDRIDVIFSNLGEWVWEAIPFSPNGFLMSRADSNFLGFKRILSDGEKEIEPEITKKWSEEHVGHEKDLNLLAKVTGYNADADRFVEGMMYFNRINIYSRDGQYGKSIFIGEPNISIERLSKTKHSELINNFLSVSTWNVGFGAAYSGLTEAEWQQGKKTDTDIYFFDWNGNPVYKATLPITVLKFDIDFEHKKLYAIDQTEDVLRVYDATPIWDAFKIQTEK